MSSLGRYRRSVGNGGGNWIEGEGEREIERKVDIDIDIDREIN